jgi:putative peptidoglycan lipid II flippase
LGGGVLLGGALQLGVQLIALKRLGFLPRIGLTWGALRTAWADPDTRNIAKLMVPALLGVSVAHISTIINTQIASHLSPGSVSWLTYADRLMEFPTALLGVAIGVVLMPQLAAARAANDAEKYSAMLDWGLRIVVLLSVPCALAVLVITQLLNLALVPVLAHAGLALAIGLGALINALWLLIGLLLRGSYKPAPGWGLFALQVLAASALLTIFLVWAANAFNWTQLRAHSGQRIGLLALMVAGAGVIYLGAAWAAGLKLAQFMRR